MKKFYPNYLFSTIAIVISLFLNINAKGQFISTPPILNGVIAAGEYGATANGTNQITNAGVTTYMTWDNTNLYIAVSGASVNDATVIYIDKDNMIPVNGGGIAQGVTVGQLLDNTNFANLPYRADLLLYARNGLFQYYTNNLGSWSVPSALNMAYNDNGLATSGGVKEFSIAWSVIGGRPGTFNFFGYNTNTAGNVYNTLPAANATGAIGITARYERYFSVTATTDGISTLPFSRDSYVFNNTANETNFGAINVFNYTMNSAGFSVTRSPSVGAWNISGTLYDNAGTIDFGNSGTFGSTNIANVNIQGGTLNLNQSNLPLNISGNVSISSGIFSLSSVSGGDLNLAGNFSKTGGTFNCNGRQLVFNGPAAQSWSSSTIETVDLFSVQNTSAAGVSISSSLNVGKGLANSFYIAPSATLSINSGIFTLANKALGTVDGTLVNKGATIFIPNTAPNIAIVTVSSSGNFIHNMDGGIIPSLSWSSGSTCGVIGWLSSGSLLGGLTQSFYNFNWNSPAQSSSISFASTLNNVAGTLNIVSTGTGSISLADNTALNFSVGKYSQSGGTVYISKGTSLPAISITGDFNMSGGLLDFNGLNSATGSLINIGANFTFSSGTITHSGVSGNGMIVFNGISAQNISCISAINKNDLQINNGATAVLNSNLNINNGFLKLQTGGTLICSTFVVSGTSSGFAQQTGSTLKTASLDASGALTTSVSSGSIQTTSRTYHSGATFEFNGSNIQSTGDFASLVTPANTVANLKINNSAAITTSGVTITTPITVSGSLNMAYGKLTTTAINSLTLGATSTLSGGSSSSFIDGPLTIIYPSNLSGTTSFHYPIGTGGNYYPFGLLNVKTGAASPSITISSASGTTGGSTNTSLSALSTTEYWTAVVNSGSFTSASIQLGRSINLGANNAIASSTTKNGVYSFIGNTAVSPSDLSSSVQNSLTFYSFGTLQPAPTISAIQPQGPITANINSGYAGQTIHIIGTNFTLSNMTVTINGVTPTFTLSSTNKIIATVPAGLVNGPLIVTNTLTGGSATKSFTYNGVISKADGDWTNNATWLHNAQPGSNDNITINNMVTISTQLATFPTQIIVNPGVSLTFSPPASQYASISVLGKILNQGDITMFDRSYIQMVPSAIFDNSNSGATFSGYDNSYIKFFDKSSLIGPINSNNLEIQDAVTFAGDITINGYLQINNKSSINGVAPIYADNSTLVYEGTTPFYPGLEWSSNTGQPGLPYNVNVGSGQFTTLNLDMVTIPLTVPGTLSVFKGVLTLGTSPYPLTVNGDLTIGFSSSINLSSVNGGDLIVKSDFKNLGSFNGNNRKVTFDNKTKDQTIDSESLLAFGNLTIDKGSYKATFLTPTSSNRIVTISNSLNVTSGKADLNNMNFVLKSNAVSTAAITKISGTVLNASNITAERFVPAHKAWILMGIPVNSNQTIKAAWQEGQANTTMLSNSNTKPGFGVHISGPKNVVGFDETIAHNYSIKSYNSSADTWDGVPNTNILKMNFQPGYMLYVRGSRAVDLNLGLGIVPDNTTLEVNGSLRQGPQTTNIGLGTGKFVLLSNPYPCTIDFHTISKPAAFGDKFSVWDPYLSGSYGAGGFVTFTWDGVSTYLSSVSGYTPAFGRYIQSGQAVMVEATANPSDNLVINESDKVTTNTSSIFSRLGSTEAPEQLRVSLNYINADATTTFVDGALVIYNDKFENGLDRTDAAKIGNFSENIYLTRDNQDLAIEARKLIRDADTVYVNFTSTARKYQLSITTENLDHPGLLGFLNDNFLKVKTALNLSDTTKYDFAVTSDPASKAANRFTITFKREETLPVTFVNINAEEKNGEVSVLWQVANQNNIKNYAVERSENGKDFYSIGVVNAKGTSTEKINYSYGDKQPSEVNFYRVVSYGFNGEIAKSNIVKVALNFITSTYSINPNPIENGLVNLHIKNVLKGNYEIRLLDNSGKSITTKIVNKENSPETIISLDQKIAHGSYLLQIIGPKKEMNTLKIIY